MSGGEKGRVFRTGCPAIRKFKGKSGKFILLEKSGKRQGNFYIYIYLKIRDFSLLNILWVCVRFIKKGMVLSGGGVCPENVKISSGKIRGKSGNVSSGYRWTPCQKKKYLFNCSLYTNILPSPSILSIRSG